MKPYRIAQIISAIIQDSHISAIWTGFIYQGPLKRGCVPILNCWGCPVTWFSCPIGGLQHFLNLHLFPFYIAGFFGAIGVVIGRMACGWVCPFGMLQDYLYKLKTIKLKLPYWFTYIKYGVLVGVAGIVAWITLEPWFCKMCPAGILEAGIPIVSADIKGDIRALVGWLFYLKVAILIVVALFAVAIKRFFCRSFCPVGAIYSVFNQFSLLKIKIDKDKCIECESCQMACPMHVPIYKSPRHIDCIRCLACSKICPTNAIRNEAR